MDRTYERNFPVSSLTVSRVNWISIQIDCVLFQTLMAVKRQISVSVYIFCLCFSLLITFHLERRLIRRSTTFTSKRESFWLFLHLRFCVACPLLPWFSVVSTFVLFLDWIVCLVCLFWFLFSHMLFFVRGNSRFFLFTPSSGICTHSWDYKI